MIKGVLLDIDNTLYDYNTTHAKALNAVYEYCRVNLLVSTDNILNAYAKARKQVHIELSETASSHNRLLYFQKMCEIIGINPMPNAFNIYNIYWDTFLDSIEVFDGVYEFLKKYKNNICFVTDLTAHIQYRKIEKMGLEKYVDKIVTSEEIGKEKPHPYMFISALNKLDMNKNEVVMIGDSFKKDIFGAVNLDIKSIWLNRKENKEDFDSTLIHEVKKFKDIIGLV